MTVCVQTIVKTKLNVLCFITHFSAAQHSTPKKKRNLFPYMLPSYVRSEKRETNTENFPNSFMVHTNTDAPTSSGFRRENFLPLCQACELVRRCSELAAIFSRTENAHQRKFLMLLTIKSKYLVRAFYSSLSWCKSTKGINEESQVLRMALKIFI